MNKKTLQETFRAWKKAAGADYAITNVDGLGDCQSCVNSELCDKYGVDSRGIWVKHWKHGMNAGADIETLERVYIAHDITEEQAKAFYKVFSEHYNITPAEYMPSKCFGLYEKNTEVWIVEYEDEFGKHDYTYTDYREALRWIDTLRRKHRVHATLNRLF